MVAFVYKGFWVAVTGAADNGCLTGPDICCGEEALTGRGILDVLKPSEPGFWNGTELMLADCLAAMRCMYCWG